MNCLYILNGSSLKISLFIFEQLYSTAANISLFTDCKCVDVY